MRINAKPDGSSSVHLEAIEKRHLMHGLGVLQMIAQHMGDELAANTGTALTVLIDKYVNGITLVADEKEGNGNDG